MFASVLIANRGEVAVRIIRTLARLGVRSIAVYSDADRGAPHVFLADEAHWVGPTPARDSYLSVERILNAALRSGAEAVHPGYGFLAESADFAAAVAAAGMVFIGPTPATMRLLGDKGHAKQFAAALDVPVIPGFHAPLADDAQLLAAATDVGFPLLIKPSAGGGGKGMQVVESASDLAVALRSSRRQALAAFGDDSLLLEQFVPTARHVEVQIFGDGNETVLHLGDRDCSLQRRAQKVVEEAPAPNLPEEVRVAMRADAVRIGRAAQYRGAGTVEFIVDAGDPGNYFFLEVNTRLQVEHPVTEAVTGLDLVELQLRVAAGEGMGIEQADVKIIGHAIEARIYAEDWQRGSLPASGTVLLFSEPPDVRIDSGFARGTYVGTDYDPMLGKVIAHGTDRPAALGRLDLALSRTQILGLATNVAALRRILADPDMQLGRATTSLIETRALDRFVPVLDPFLLMVAGLPATNNVQSTWETESGWRISGTVPIRRRLLDDDDHVHEISVLRTGSSTTVVSVGTKSAKITTEVVPGEPNTHLITIDGETRNITSAVDAIGDIWIGFEGAATRFRPAANLHTGELESVAVDDGALRSPMPGMVVQVVKHVGDRVIGGTLIAVVEAMKMEYPISAPFAGTLTSLEVGVGTQVGRDDLVAVLKPDPGPPTGEAASSVP